MRPISRPGRHLLSRALLAAAGFALVACGDDAAAPPISETVEPVEREVALAPAEALSAMAARHAQEMLAVSPELSTSLGIGEDIAGEGYLSRLGGYGFAANQRAVA